MAEKQRKVDGLTNSAGSAVPCPDELIDAIDQLDPVSREDFNDMKEICREQKKRQKRIVTPTSSFGRCSSEKARKSGKSRKRDSYKELAKALHSGCTTVFASWEGHAFGSDD